MNSGRAQTAFEVALVATVVVAAVAWATALSSSLIGLTALLAVVLVPMLLATAWMLMLISNRLSEKYHAIIRTILRPRRDFLAAKRGGGNIHGIRWTLYEIASALLFLIVFLFYFLVMIVFFYGLGGQPLSDPTRLMTAAFLGTSVLHFSGSAEAGPPKIVFEFLVPFGIIAGLIDLIVIGLPTLLSLGSAHAPVFLLFFAAYCGLDALVQHKRSDREGQGGSQQGDEIARTSGAGKTERSPIRAVMIAMIGVALAFILILRSPNTASINEQTWSTVLTILATGMVTFLSSWGVYLLRERRRKAGFKRTLAIEVDLNTDECKRIISLLATQVESGAFDSLRIRIEPLPLMNVVFEAFRSDLRFLNRDLLQKVLIFYHRLDEANHYVELSGEFAIPGFARKAATAAITALEQASEEGRSLLKALLPESDIRGKGPTAPVQPTLEKLNVTSREEQHGQPPPK